MDVTVGDRSIAVVTASSLEEYIISKVKEEHQDDENSFFVVNVGQLVDILKTWKTALPYVETFYAVKCNDDPVLLKLLAATLPGFDCASKVDLSNLLFTCILVTYYTVMACTV